MPPRNRKGKAAPPLSCVEDPPPSFEGCADDDPPPFNDEPPNQNKTAQKSSSSSRVACAREEIQALKICMMARKALDDSGDMVKAFRLALIAKEMSPGSSEAINLVAHIEARVRTDQEEASTLMTPHQYEVVKVTCTAAALVAAGAYNDEGRTPALFCLVPVCTLLMLFFTVIMCHRLAKPKALFPAISELGMEEPAMGVYRMGFLFTGGLLAVHLHLWNTIMQDHFMEGCGQSSGRSSSSSFAEDFKNIYHYGLYSALGCALQGVVTMQKEPTPQSMLHWAGAGLFCWGSFKHVMEIRKLYDLAMPWSYVMQKADVGLLHAVRCKWMDVSPVCMFVLTLLFQIASAFRTQTPAQKQRAEAAARRRAKGLPATEEEEDGSSPIMNAMGLIQWVVILQFALWYASYSVEMVYGHDWGQGFKAQLRDSKNPYAGWERGKAL